jgi:hypothetical protein
MEALSTTGLDESLPLVLALPRRLALAYFDLKK